MGLIARLKRLWKITDPIVDSDLDYVTGLEEHIQQFESIIATYDKQVGDLISKTDPDKLYKIFIDNFENGKNKKTVYCR